MNKYIMVFIIPVFPIVIIVDPVVGGHPVHHVEDGTNDGRHGGDPQPHPRRERVDEQLHAGQRLGTSTNQS